jgi:lysophospholipase L1-like esterase
VTRWLAITVMSSVVVVTGCSSSTAPTPVPPTDTTDPPSVTCPPPQTIQLTAEVTSTPVVYGAATATGGKPPVTTVCTPPSGSLFNTGQTTVSCTATDAVQRTSTCSLIVTVVAPPTLTATSFVAFGDSITAGESGLGSLQGGLGAFAGSRFHRTVLLPFDQRYPSVLQRNLAARYQTQMLQVANGGNGGEAIADPSTFPRFAGILQGPYAVVLIMEGTNDLFVHDSLTIPPAISGLQQMIREAKNRGVTPYLATIPPINPNGFRGATYSWDLVPVFNDRVRALAASENVTLVDVYLGFNNDFSLLGIDGLHPNADGYAKIAELFFVAIRQTLETSAPASRGAGGAFSGRTR